MYWLLPAKISGSSLLNHLQTDQKTLWEDPASEQCLAMSDNYANKNSLHFLFRFDIRQAGQFDEHGTSVWRVCWNITGTILATSGDDGCVKLWKANYMDNWKCVSTLRADGQMTGPGLGSNPVSAALGKAGFTKLGMVSSQANWH